MSNIVGEKLMLVMHFWDLKSYIIEGMSDQYWNGYMAGMKHVIAA